MKKTFFLELFFISIIIFSVVWSGFIYKTVIKAEGKEKKNLRNPLWID